MRFLSARLFNSVSLLALDFDAFSLHLGVRPRDWQWPRRRWDGWLMSCGFGPLFAVYW